MCHGAHVLPRDLSRLEGGDIYISINGVEIAADVAILRNDITAIFSPAYLAG